MRERSYGSAKATFFDKAAVRAAVEEYARSMPREHPEIVRIILFGSMVSGIPVPGSDVDIIIVVSHSDEQFIDRYLTFAPRGFPVGMDVFTYTEAELAKMIAEDNMFLRRALREGEVLYEKRPE